MNIIVFFKAFTPIVFYLHGEVYHPEPKVSDVMAHLVYRYWVAIEHFDINLWLKYYENISDLYMDKN